MLAEPALVAPVAVAVAADPVPVEAVPLAAAPVAVEQETEEGTLTPLAEQIWEAKTTAEDWSAWSQAPTRQQAMLPRKSWLEQMHLGSVPQPA